MAYTREIQQTRNLAGSGASRVPAPEVTVPVMACGISHGENLCNVRRPQIAWKCTQPTKALQNRKHEIRVTHLTIVYTYRYLQTRTNINASSATLPNILHCSPIMTKAVLNPTKCTQSVSIFRGCFSFTVETPRKVGGESVTQTPHFKL